MTHQPAISFSNSFHFPFTRAGGRTSNVRQKQKTVIPNLLRVTMSVGWLVAATIAGFYTFFCWICASDGWASSIWINRHADQLAIAAGAIGFGCGLLGGIRRWTRARWGIADILAGLPMIAFVLSVMGLSIAAHGIN